MIVTTKNFGQVLKKLSQLGLYGLDTETTGLSLKDKLFSIIFADEVDGYYFNFNGGADHLGGRAPAECILPWTWLAEMEAIIENKDSLFFLHNAKFDLGMLAKDGLSILGVVHDTEVVERVLKNNHLGHKPYSLKSVAPRYGFQKDGSVDEYIKEHGLFTKVHVPGKDKPMELLHFDKVPFNIIAPYGTTDAVITRAIGIKQLEKIRTLDGTTQVGRGPLMEVIRDEYALTKTCARVERTGIRIDRNYTERALSHVQEAARKACAEFKGLTGLEYQDSASAIAEAFLKSGITLPLTRTGKPCTNKQVLDDLENPVADKIREIRKFQKLGSTYYSSFLYYADGDDLIHANMRQAGTETLRFSYSNPNLQNIPKEDEPEDREKPFIVRKCFVPLNSEWCFVPIDYKQQEYRMMADYAGETKLIDAILSGEDVHDATARLLGVTRKQAKTLNFGLLYGMGGSKLAKALGIPLEDALALRFQYFSKLPAIKRFVKAVMKNGSDRGFIYNWRGVHYHVWSSEHAYKLPNHIIQGGCAMVVRKAMVLLDEYLKTNRLRTRFVIQVHDELLFQVHRSEFEHIPEFKKIMENIYPSFNGMRLECSLEHSWKSWSKWDMTGGMPG